MTPEPSTSGAPKGIRRLLPLTAVAAVFVVFSPALGGSWLSTWDDGVNFLQNPHYRGLGASNLAWMFTNTMGHYMPLTWMTLGLDFELWGMNPAGYHFSNVLLHAVNALLCFRLLSAFLRRLPSAASASAWTLDVAALAGTFLYALHPLRVESVAWITERRDLMAGLFFLPCVTSYLNAAPAAPGAPMESRGYRLSILFFALSLLSKTIGMTLPLALLVMDVFPLGRFARGADGRIPWKRPVLEKLPFFALTAAAVLVTGYTTENAGSFRADVTYSAAQILTQPGYKLALYLSKTFVPLGLSPLYVYRPPTGLFEARFLLSSALVLGLTAVLAALRRRLPGGLAAWAAFAVLLAPVISPLQAGPHVVADRYTYLSGLLLSALGAAAVLRLASAGAPARAAGALAGLALLVALGGLAHAYCRVWKDGEDLWSAALRADPANTDAWLNRGVSRVQKGRSAEAIPDFSEGLRLRPRDAMIQTNLANAKLHTGDLKGALEDVQEALAWSPAYALGYRTLGDILKLRGRPGESEEAYSKALTLNPLLMEVYVDRAVVRGQSGKLKEAVEDCSLALLLDPGFAPAYVNRGVARGELGDLNGAIEDYTQALRIQGDLTAAWGGRGMCRALQGRWAEAVADFENALATAKPGWPFRKDTERRLEEARRRLRGR